MPKAFPFPITVGTDICHVNRIFEILTKSRHGFASTKWRRFIDRVLNEREFEDAVKRGRLKLRLLENGAKTDNEVQLMKSMAKFLGGRFAAKEATMKANPSLRLTLHDITITTGKKSQTPSAPFALIRATNYSLSSVEEQTIPLSISHDGEYATAVALGLYVSGDRRHFQAPTSLPDTEPDPREYRSVLQQPPTPKESDKPKLEAHTVKIYNLNPQIDKPMLLDIFKQRYSSVRWVTIVAPNLRFPDPSQPPDGKGYVTFGFYYEAKRAVKEMDKLIVLGQMIKVLHVKNHVIAKREEEGGTWLFNEDIEGSTTNQDAQNDLETKQDAGEAVPELEFKRLSQGNVFQDNPVVEYQKEQHIRNRNPAREFEDPYPSWNTEEIIRTGDWDGIEGGRIDAAELEDIFRHEEMKRERRRQEKERLQRVREQLIQEGALKKNAFPVPANRRGFFVRD